MINPLASALTIISSLALLSCHTSTRPTANISKQLLDPSPDKILSNQSPALLHSDDLKVLLREKGKDTVASRKADKLFSSTFVDNSHYRSKGIPKASEHPILGPSIRVSTWNVEKSINANNAASALGSEQSFIKDLDPKVLKKKAAYDKALEQRAILAASDILILQEMDIGHCRSGYAFAAKKMAQEMKMNFVYAPQQLEIDPVYLGVEDIKFGNGAVDHTACKHLQGEPKEYKGVFGVAVLSRYPIKYVQSFPLENQPYDWFDKEIVKPDFFEKTRRFGAQKLFKARPTREVKAGGRGFTRVDLHVPNVPHETITVINIHLEIKTEPKNRVEQLREILSYINEIENPVIMAGDFNSASRDLSSTSFKRASIRATKNSSNLVSAGLFLANVTGVSHIRNAINSYKNFCDPLAFGIPGILPNKTRPMFKMIKDYRFKDGGAFDFRGDSNRSINKVRRSLSNSNQRNRIKGFRPTFSVPRPIGPIGLERLDWIFVKSFLGSPKDKKGPYKLAPHFGQTLGAINRSLATKYSDHHPITAVLPFNEPNLK